MGQSKLNPAMKAALIKKFKNRQASKEEAVSKGLHKGLRMPEAKIVITITPNSVKVDGGNMPLPLILVNLLIGQQVMLDKMMGKETEPPSILEAPANVLGPNGRINGIG